MSEDKTPYISAGPISEPLRWEILTKDDGLWIHWFDSDAIEKLGSKAQVFAKWTEIIAADEAGGR
jgi:hypothetical protein